MMDYFQNEVDKKIEWFCPDEICFEECGIKQFNFILLGILEVELHAGDGEDGE